MTDPTRTTREMKALVLPAFGTPPTVKTVPIPAVTPGSAVVQIYCAQVLPYAGEIFSGAMQFELMLPATIGGSAIGRTVEVGPDATTLLPGQLVLVDSYIRGRDNVQEGFLSGTHAGGTNGSRKLAGGEWKDSVYAEYAKVPLENMHALDENRLLSSIDNNGLGYTMEDLGYLLRLAVPTGGLSDLNVRAGESIVIAPATGAFGGAAVELAVAMGANVVACARNAKSLEKLAGIGGGGFVKTVQLTGDVEKDTSAITAAGGQIDSYLDFSPAAAKASTHIMACLMALKVEGKACFMGGIVDAISIPYRLLMFRSLKLHGKFMYERSDLAKLIKLTEQGRLVLGSRAGLRTEGVYGLSQWENAFETAAANSGWGSQVLIDPRKD